MHPNLDNAPVGPGGWLTLDGEWLPYDPGEDGHQVVLVYKEGEVHAEVTETIGTPFDAMTSLHGCHAEPPATHGGIFSDSFFFRPNLLFSFLDDYRIEA